MTKAVLSLLFAAVLCTSCVTTPRFNSTDLDDKIGQMLMVGFRGMTVEESSFIAADIQQRNLGGVILFSYDVALKQQQRNIQSPAQLKRLTATLEQLAETPLLIAIDQEGGRIARLTQRNGFPATLSHQQLGDENDLNSTFDHSLALAATLAQQGINLNMAPVVDLATNPDNPVIAKLGRSFSADPQRVTAHATAYIEAHHQQQLLTCLKHFPGHGSSHGDSHLGFTDVTASWDDTELIPYKQLIDTGQVDAIMTAHVFNAQLDPHYPATLSKATIDGLLRQKLGFDGVVISDDMQMGAITELFDFDSAIQQALEAGVDLLVFGNNLRYDETVVPRAIEVIHKLIDDGVLSAERIDQSYQRIMKLKLRLHNR